MKKNIWVLGFFVSDIINKRGFWPFWLMLTGLGPNHLTEVFPWSFHWKLV